LSIIDADSCYRGLDVESFKNLVICLIEDLGPFPRGAVFYCFEDDGDKIWLSATEDHLGMREFNLSAELKKYFKIH